MGAPLQNNVGAASVSDILTALKNIVLALSNQADTNLTLAGKLIATAITAPTVISVAAGRVVKVSVIVAGTSGGTIYDSTSVTSLAKPVAKIPVAEGITKVNIPVTVGIVVIPGAGQTVTVSYS